MYLNCHTGFSFKHGTMPIKALFEEARRCGLHKLVLTEINNTASYMEMLRICHEHQTGSHEDSRYELDIAVGIEFRTENDLLYIAIAKNNAGFETVNRFLSHHNETNEPLPFPAPEFGGDVFVIYPFAKRKPQELRNNEYIGIKKHELAERSLAESIEAFNNKFVALHPVTFLPPETGRGGQVIYRDHNIHRLLRCIANNSLLSKLPPDQQA